MPLLQAAYHHTIELHQTQDWTDKPYSIYKDPLWNTVKQSQGFDDVWFYHCDHLGTPQEMSDQTGAIVWKAEYKGWGNVKQRKPSRISSKIVKLFQIISVFKVSILMKRQGYITIVIVIIRRM
ncbi:hypothetical protein F886_01803 [Acinetobacter sp. NIPH 542]|nr:hypothetical protein F886_01803 [Acinetobacter sp. NIPH 542]